jgi:hypothetical protein
MAVVRTAYWFRIPYEGGIKHCAVIADTLELCFIIIENTYNVDPLDIVYLHRSFDVVE